MNKIIRAESVINGSRNIEHLHTLEHFPVFVGCTDDPQEKDLFADMLWDICRNSGIIQLRELLPLDLVYSIYHSEALGKIWQEHHLEFCQFISGYSGKSILEIGGSNGFLAKEYTKRHSDVDWTIVEPNPGFAGAGRIKVIKKFFDENYRLKGIDTIVHSHVLEHIYEPVKFIENISFGLAEGLYHLFSVPNLYEYLENRFTNTINFEHTCFLTEDLIDYLLLNRGFEIVEKYYFGKHSIFYATRKKENVEKCALKNHFESYKKMYLDFIKYYDSEVVRLNNLIDNFNGEVYLFGAHVFSQFLLNIGINKKRIVGILDNSSEKEGKRLYGSSLFVSKPEVLKEKSKNVAVILKAGQYQDEIRNQLKEINSKILIWE